MISCSWISVCLNSEQRNRSVNNLFLKKRLQGSGWSLNHEPLVYLIVIGNDAEDKPSAVAVIVTVPGLFLAPIIAKAKPLNALR